MTIQIVKTSRNKEVLIPQELIRNDEILTEGINQYCSTNNLNPVFIDDCVAIFDDHLLIAAYSEEINSQSLS
jgi:hypothetical protein